MEKNVNLFPATLAEKTNVVGAHVSNNLFENNKK